MDNQDVHEFLFVEKAQEDFISSLIEVNNFSQKVSSILDFITLLQVTIDLSASILKADKGFLLIQEKDNKDFTIKATHNLEKETEDIDKFSFFVLKKIIANLNTNNNVNIINTINIPEFRTFRNIIISKIKVRDELLGYLCLVNKKSTPSKFDERDKYLIETLANQSGVAISNSYLYEKVKSETDLRNHLQRYLPRNIVSKIVDNNMNISMAGEEQECSILFADICGFTSMSERMKPSVIVRMLNEYLTVMTKVIFSYNGSVDKFIGDGIMAVFGVPVVTPNHAMEAVLAALEMKKQAKSLRERFFKEFGIAAFNIRIGINTGKAIYGNFGSPQRMDFTVIGDSVNTASRLESTATPGTIIISQSTHDKVKHQIKATEFPPVKLKGKAEPVKVFEVYDKAEDHDIRTTESNSNIRMHIRIPLKTFVTISRGTNRSNGLIRDISIGGVSVGTVGNYKLDEIIMMTFKLKNELTFRNIKGIIKHIDKAKFDIIGGKTNIVMGVEFVDLPDDVSKPLYYFINAESSK
jgi:class 3 adenylate cyclase